MVTEFRVSIRLGKSTPLGVIAILNKVINGVESEAKPPKHEFFECDNWGELLSGSNESYFKKCGQFWDIHIHADIEVHDDEIQKFIKWITPYTKIHSEKEWIGYSWSRELEEPEQIFINAKPKEKC